MIVWNREYDYEYPSSYWSICLGLREEGGEGEEEMRGRDKEKSEKVSVGLSIYFREREDSPMASIMHASLALASSSVT